MKRSTIADALKILEKKGIIKRVLYPKNKKLYQLIEAKKIKELINQKISQLTYSLKEIDCLEENENKYKKVKIIFFKGRSGIHHMMQEVLYCKSRLNLYISSFNKVVDLMGRNYWLNFFQERTKRGIYSKALRTKKLSDKSQDVYQDYKHQEVRYIDLDPDMGPGINIFDDKVAILSNDENGFGLLIESQEISQAMRGIFNKLWGIGRK